MSVAPASSNLFFFSSLVKLSSFSIYLAISLFSASYLLSSYAFPEKSKGLNLPFDIASVYFLINYPVLSSSSFVAFSLSANSSSIAYRRF
nr:MAG TPA: hypothetical protein [Bacteriophage sp.]